VGVNAAAGALTGGCTDAATGADGVETGDSSARGGGVTATGGGAVTAAGGCACGAEIAAAGGLLAGSAGLAGSGGEGFRGFPITTAARGGVWLVFFPLDRLPPRFAICSLWPTRGASGNAQEIE
jgi:hypothetical protein